MTAEIDIDSDLRPIPCMLMRGGTSRGLFFLETGRVLAAVTVASACVLEGSAAQGLAVVPDGPAKKISVEHPTGESGVELGIDPANPQNVTRAALLRTARLIMRGEVMIPASAWKGQ
jgi:4-oxalomesaconate tautomerase